MKRTSSIICCVEEYSGINWILNGILEKKSVAELLAGTVLVCVRAVVRWYMESFPRHRHKLCANIVLPRRIRGARRGSRTYPSGSRDSQARSRGSINARERNERGRWDRGALGFAGSLREITSCVIILRWRGRGEGGTHQRISTVEVFVLFFSVGQSYFDLNASPNFDHNIRRTIFFFKF